MISLDAGAIRGALSEDVAARLFSFEVFSEIESTNSYLMQQEAPPPGHASVALTDNQTMGRGRHGRTWQSPPGSGLCVSVGFTFATQPANLPALTLAIGLGAIAALEGLGVSGVQLKWPNDLVAGDGKLGGILTETRSHSSGLISIVSGLGINVDLVPVSRQTGRTASRILPGSSIPCRLVTCLQRVWQTGSAQHLLITKRAASSTSLQAGQRKTVLEALIASHFGQRKCSKRPID